MGLTLGDPEGNLPRPVSTWQFHFKFDLFSENIVQSSINMLKQAGICFEKLHSDGIPHRLFA